MILAFGATGTTGGEVARQLIQAGQKPRLLVRNPSKASAFDGKAEIIRVISTVLNH
jgi:(4-alkanoyl-5-oxo-2,5-dihydrofuran-3-yl)methyl phosphate reductase